MTWYLTDIPLLLLMAALTLRPCFLDGPLEKYEEAIHLSWVQGIYSGRKPYRDFYINYGPLYTYHFYFFHRLLGKSLRTHRLVMAVGNYLSLVAAYTLGTFVLPEGMGRLALAILLPLIVIDQKALTCWGGFRIGSGLLACIPLILALTSNNPWLFALAGSLAVIALLYSFDEGCTALATFPLVLGGLLVFFDVPFSSLLAGMIWYTAGAAIPAVVFLGWLVKNNAVRGYFRDTVLGVLRTNSWRGGSVYLPRPFQGTYGLNGKLMTFFSDDCFFYWSMACAMLVVIMTGDTLLNCLPVCMPTGIALFVMLLFGLLHLVTSWRLTNGPQFKTFLPTVIVLGTAAICHAGFGATEAGLSGLLLMMALSSGNLRFLYYHYRGRLFYPLPLDFYSGVRMPAPICDYLSRLESAIRKHAGNGEVLFVPYDGSMSFFADVSFWGRHSVTMTVRFFDEDYTELLENFTLSTSRIIVIEPETPDLLPNLESKKKLSELYVLTKSTFQIIDTITPQTTDRHFRERSVTLWPGSWFWFNKKYMMYPAFVYAAKNG